MITRMTALAQACRDAASQLNALETLAESVALELGSGKSADLPRQETRAASVTTMNQPKQRKISPKAKGNELRKKWVSERQRQGTPLRHVGRVLYETPTRRQVGIATATEGPQGPDKWFLGLPDQRLEVAVLLCETESGDLHDFVLPQDFLADVWDLLSRSGGQVKFHIASHGANFEFGIPGGASRSINAFRSNYTSLR